MTTAREHCHRTSLPKLSVFYQMSLFKNNIIGEKNVAGREMIFSVVK